MSKPSFCPHCEHCHAEAMVGKRVRLLTNGLLGDHKGEVGKIVPYPSIMTQYRDVFLVQVGDYSGAYHINQLKVL